MTLQEQLISIRKNWDNWTGWIDKKHTLILEGSVQPTIVSPCYKIKISFKVGQNPFVQVISPELKLYPGKTSLPHVNSHPDNPLCLFLFEFDNRKDALAETVVVWITWWLYFYEIWYQTGKWIARGTHPNFW